MAEVAVNIGGQTIRMARGTAEVYNRTYREESYAMRELRAAQQTLSRATRPDTIAAAQTRYRNAREAINAANAERNYILSRRRRS